uniref:muscle M-line assembly protein unc-89-like isoform X2 n=1 Tax=Styela clava TaxID=7725 RepID=UPI0019395837|nr:muscle M-line assembly protein unc-89-like isoform X2 [Styela clava]
MKSTFQTFKKKILPKNNSNSKSEKAKRKIIHPHLEEQKENHVAVTPVIIVDQEIDKDEQSGSIIASDASPVKPRSKTFAWPGKSNKKKYEIKDDETSEGVKTMSDGNITPSASENSSLATPTRRKTRSPITRLGGMIRRSMYGMRFSSIDDNRESVEKDSDPIARPKSLYVLNTSSSTSVLSIVRKSLRRRSRQSDGDVPMPVVTIEPSQCDADATPEKLSVDFTPENLFSDIESKESQKCSSEDISSSKSSVELETEESDEPDAAKSMSIGSDVTKSTNDLKKTGSEINLDLDMNDLPISVPRLNNKAAYDKIALRPKRRAAGRSRGAQQKHVIRVEAQINGFPDSPTIEDEKEEISRDISPPRAKKPRPPSFSLQPPQAEQSATGSGTTVTPNRHSMFGRSPLGAAPGMIVPTLEDMQKIKLRKRQPELEPKTTDKSTKEKPVSNKSDVDKSKLSKKSNSSEKKPTKQDQKGLSDGGSSIFPWKNKSSSSSKSPPANPNAPEDAQKENEKPKPSKKNVSAKDSKLGSASKLFSGNDKKETTKKKSFGLGRKDKNHSGNNSKTKSENTTAESVVKMDLSSSEKEIEEKTNVESEKMNAHQDGGESPEIVENEPKQKHNVKSKYADMLKLEAEKLAEKRVDDDHEKPPSPISPLDVEKMIFGDSSKQITVEHNEIPQIDKPDSPKSPLEQKISIFGETFKLKSPDKTTNTFTINNVTETESAKEKEQDVTIKKNTVVQEEKKDEPLSPVRKVTSPIETHVQAKSILKRSKSHEYNADITKHVVQSGQCAKVENLKYKDDISEQPSSEQVEESKSQVSDKITLTTKKKSSPIFPRALNEDQKHVFGDRKIRANTEPSVGKTKEPSTNEGQKSTTISPKTPTNPLLDEQPGGLYSRNKLKSIGDRTGTEKFGERKSESFKASLVTSPTRALRTRSFNVGSNSPVQAKILAGQKNKAETRDTIEKIPSSRTLSPTKEKPAIATKPPKTPDKSPMKTSKTLFQDVENNNIKPTEKVETIKQLDKSEESEVIVKPVLRRNTTKSRSSRGKDDKNTDGVPSWIQLAKRRSKIWEDGQAKNETNSSSQKTTADKAPEKDAGRPKSLKVTLAESTNKPEVEENVSKPAPKERKNLPGKIIASNTARFEKDTNASRERPNLPQKKSTTPTSKSSIAPKERKGSLMSPDPPSPTSDQTNRTAPIPNISMVSPKHVMSGSKEVKSDGQPSWLAIAMRKQKTWVKEETV